MKKIFSLICALSALIFGALFTGCDADDNEFIAQRTLGFIEPNQTATTQLNINGQVLTEKKKQLILMYMQIMQQRKIL